MKPLVTTLLACILMILLCLSPCRSSPLLDNLKLSGGFKASILKPLEGDFREPLWASNGKRIVTGDALISLGNGSLDPAGKVRLDPSLKPVGWIPGQDKLIVLKEDENSNELCLHDLKKNETMPIQLPVKKPWRKARILDPQMTRSGEIVGVFQKEAEDSSVKECFVFVTDASGKSFRILTENQVYLVKSKIFFMGKKVSYGKLRCPSLSGDGKKLCYLSMTEGEPRKCVFDLCIRDLTNSTTRVVLQDIASPGSPAWTPDGKAIALKHRGEGGKSEIMIITSEGALVTRIAAGSLAKEGALQGDDVSWSFDGEWLAFLCEGGKGLAVSSKAGDIRITVAQVKSVEGGDGDDSFVSPRWSPVALDLAYLECSKMTDRVLSFLFLARLAP
jgi:hypothetical protein